MPPGNGDSPRELFLIDGNSLAYRAFFALPESISTSDGRPTNAIFGFASMLVKIISEYGVKPTLVVWDAGMSGRKEVYEEYKGQRDSKPDLLAEQWPYMQPLVDAFGYENVRVEGYEADDIDLVGDFLFERGIYVTLAAYPLVPRNQVGFRVQVTAANTDEEVADLCAALAELSTKFRMRDAA